METKIRKITDKNGKIYIANIEKIAYSSNELCFSIIYSFCPSNDTIKNDITENVGFIKVYSSKAIQPKKEINGLVEIEYGVNKDYRNRGIASAMLKSVLHAIFVDGVVNEEMQKICSCDVNKVMLAINSNNQASLEVAQKNGFSLKETPDDVRATITREEYLESHKKANFNTENLALA